MIKVLVFSLMLLAGAAACPAALEWRTTDLQLAAQPGQQSMSVVFPFRNAGEKPVRILSLDPSCSCMSAAPVRAVCAPGESDEIRVELVLAGYSGRVRRSVAVATDDPGGRFAELTMTVEIPELVAITPRFLFWRVGDQPEEKVSEVVLADPKATAPGGIECANPRFQVQLSPLQPGAFRLAVRPADTRRPDEAMVHLTVITGGRPQTYVIYAAVK